MMRVKRRSIPKFIILSYNKPCVSNKTKEDREQSRMGVGKKGLKAGCYCVCVCVQYIIKKVINDLNHPPTDCVDYIFNKLSFKYLYPPTLNWLSLPH